MVEDCAHVLHCQEANRVDCMLKSIDRLETWLREQNTEPRLKTALIK